MTFADLTRTLNDVLHGGEIGTPVSLRLFLHLPEPKADFGSAVAVLMRLAGTVFPCEDADLAARLDSDKRQLNVLLRLSDGRTVSLTVVRGGVTTTPLHLLLIGNRGIARLEGGDTVVNLSSEDVAEDVDRWKKRIEAAVQ